MRSRRQKNRSGYVLLVVMAASILVVTVLGTLAKISLRRAVEAHDAAISLQQRWGSLTLQRVLLEKAPTIFETRQKILEGLSPDAPPPAPYIRDAITIGDVTFDILLGDEDAKLNLNAVYHQVGRQKTEKAIVQATGSHLRLNLNLAPAVAPQSISRERTKLSLRNNGVEEEGEEAPPVPDAFGSWGQVFDITSLQAQAGSDLILPIVTTKMTCWGSGQLNFRRASDEAILATAGLVVQDGGARRILQRYRQNPAASLQVLLRLEVKNDDNRERLLGLLSEISNNFSIWTSASTKTGRGLTEFMVSRRDQEGVTRYSKFAH